MLNKRKEYLPYLCKACNFVLCDSCTDICTCLKCKKMVCGTHCIRCHICSKRSCKEKGCIVDFHICQMCQLTFCQEHFEEHKKFNQAEVYKMKCVVDKCRLSQGLGPNGIEDLCKYLRHTSCIKELKLRMSLIR